MSMTVSASIPPSSPAPAGSPLESLRAGDLATTVKRLQDLVRAKPADAKLRTFLFQLSCLTGQWPRALNQLEVASELDPSTLPMVQTYRETIACETLRAEVMAGRRAPMLFGEPEPWLALMIEALLRDGRGEHDAARQLRAQALEQAPASAGTIDGTPFEWIADADMRLGPVVEAIVNGKYYWMPFSRLSQLTIEAPADLRDSVWMPANFEFTNGGQTVGFIPTRYPGSEASTDGLIALARKTEWLEPRPDFFTGLGQRLWTSDAGDHPLMDVRALQFAAAAEA